MIVGLRTRLRRVGRDETDHLPRWQADAALMRRWRDSGSLPSPPLLERGVADGLAADETSLTLVIETLDGTPVGWLGVEEIDARHRSAVVALGVAEPSADEVYGRDALDAVCRYLFEQRGLHRIVATVSTDDDRAVRVYAHVGFRGEGVLRGNVRIDGALRDGIVMSLLPGERRD